MKTTVDRMLARDLVATLAPVWQRARGSSSTRRGPHREYVRLRSDGSVLVAEGGSSWRWMSAEIPLLDGDLDVVVHARTLAGVLAAAGGTVVTLTVAIDGSLHVEGTRSIMMAPEPTWVLEDVDALAPTIVRPEDGLDLPAGTLSDLVTVARAASTDGARPILTGVLIRRGLIAATDAYRMAWTSGVDLCDALGDMVIPADVWATVASWADTDPLTVARATCADAPGIWITGTRVRGPRRSPRTVRTTLWQEAIDEVGAGKFPNVHRLIPKLDDAVTTVEVDAAMLVDALSAARTIAGLGRHAWNRPMLLDVTGDTLTLTLTRGPDEDARVGLCEQLPIKRRGGISASVAVNPARLASAIHGAASTDGATVTIHLYESLKPIVIDTPSLVRTLLMPMRVDS